MRILIDSIDKRVSVPLIEELYNQGYKVHGICFKGQSPLNKDRIEQTYTLDEANVKEQLQLLLNRYCEEDVLIFGNPNLIEIVNIIKPKIKYLFPTTEQIQLVNNKRKLHNLVLQLGIKTPLIMENIKVSCIIKLNVSEKTTLKPKDRYQYVRTQEDIVKGKAFFEKHEDTIIQEIISGKGYGVSMLLDEESNLVDYIVHQRLLEYPISGGPSAICKSVIDTRKVEEAYSLLKSIRWKGLAMVEFKGDYLLEVNPRFWGSMPLIFLAKSDFFKNYMSIINDRLILKDTKPQYKSDVYMHYLPQSVLSIVELARGKNIGQALLGIINAIRSKEGILKFRHPTPFFRYLHSVIKRRTK